MSKVDYQNKVRPISLSTPDATAPTAPPTCRRDGTGRGGPWRGSGHRSVWLRGAGASWFDAEEGRGVRDRGEVWDELVQSAGQTWVRLILWNPKLRINWTNCFAKWFSVLKRSKHHTLNLKIRVNWTYFVFWETSSVASEGQYKIKENMIFRQNYINVYISILFKSFLPLALSECFFLLERQWVFESSVLVAYNPSHNLS